MCMLRTVYAEMLQFGGPSGNGVLNFAQWDVDIPAQRQPLQPEEELLSSGLHSGGTEIWTGSVTRSGRADGLQLICQNDFTRPTEEHVLYVSFTTLHMDCVRKLMTAVTSLYAPPAHAARNGPKAPQAITTQISG